MKILVAEDDDIFRSLIAAILSEAGYEVEAEPDGLRAWERLDGEGADLCVFDVDMPGMTGIELLKRLRSDARFCGLPVIMLTVKALVEDQLKGYNAGADEYLPKPIEAQVFLARVAALARKTGKRLL
ncbi:MAG: hypothetical protein A2X31_00365 [Elusimicrobia bacterium GWB2_63_22]|nr:MAG: hypothetical protein A2X31_00365 [Elusimicrobia bacterium GWB2_63_22]